MGQDPVLVFGDLAHIRRLEPDDTGDMRFRGASRWSGELTQGRRLWGLILLLGAAASFATVPLFVTWLVREGVGVWFLLAARLAVSSLVLAVSVTAVAKGSPRITDRGNLLFLTMNGLLVLVLFATYLFPLGLGMAPTKLVLLSYLSPVFVAVMSTRFLGESLTGKKLAAIAIGLTGAMLTLQVWEIRRPEHIGLADLLAVSNGVVYAITIVLGRKNGLRERMHPMAFTLWSFVFALAWLVVAGAIVAIVQGPSVVRSQLPGQMTPRIMEYLLGLVLIATVTPVALLYAGLKHTEAGSASIIMLTEPICVFLLTFVFLHQSIGWWQIAGGVAIVSAGLLVAR